MDVMIYGSQHLPPTHNLVQVEIDNMFKWNEKAQDTIHPIEYAALYTSENRNNPPFRSWKRTYIL